MVYDELLDKYMKRFLDGYNVNFLAYGQTGTGKTHTLLGPLDLSPSSREP
jgi:DNA replication protein DnaC